MDAEEIMIRNANRLMQKFRTEDKAAENKNKPILVSDDVRNTKDFSFSKITPNNRIGDSGQLLLAKSKANRSERYLVKHEFTDCAANEFVYTKLAQAMNLKMPGAVLFQLSPDEKRKIFGTEYIIGTRYLNIIIENPAFVQIRDRASNWKDYIRFRALYDLFLENDSFEVLLADDGNIYRVDTSASFILSNFMFDKAGVNVSVNGFIPKEYVKNFVKNLDYSQHWQHFETDNLLNIVREQYGKDMISVYKEPFERIQEIPGSYIDDFLNTLCYFYPDFIGDYFKRFITAAKNQAHIILKQNV